MDFIFDPGLVLYLPLYELDGASFASRDAYRHLCTATGTGWRPLGRYFDGVDDYINCGTSAELDMGTNDITTIAWINGSKVTNVYHHIVGKRTDAIGYQMHCNQNNGLLRAAIGDSSGVSYGSPTGGSDVLDGNWHMVAVVFDRDAQATFFVDGQVNGTGVNISARQGSINNSKPCVVGIYPHDLSSNPFKNLIGEVWIYRRGLTLVEVQDIYLATKWRYR